MPIQVGAASLAQVVASSATYPHEVLRSHMHVDGTASPAFMAVTARQVGPWGSVIENELHSPYPCQSPPASSLAFLPCNWLNGMSMLRALSEVREELFFCCFTWFTG